MALISHVLMFSGGLIVGLVLYPLVKLINMEELNQLLNWLVGMALSPFRLLSRYMRSRTAAIRNAAEMRAAAGNIDPREQQISDSAQTIRSILLSMTRVMQRTDKAASDSSQALGDVKGSIDQMNLPKDLLEVHQVLVQEVDRVISSNTILKEELATTQEVLAEQKRQIENLRTAVRIDGLTQLANRAYFDEKLSESLSLFKRHNEPFSLMMADLDNFKEINDTYGHPAGDRILKGVAFKLKESLRSSDFVARFGGDEFALILIRASEKTALDVGMKLCKSLRESRFLLDNVPVTVTLSIGVAEVNANDTEENLIKRADEALYRAKQSGRNNAMMS